MKMDGWSSGCSWEAMYAPFPEEREDSLAWDSKMAFWMAAIRRLCLSRKTAIFQLSQLPVDFQRYGRMPKCLAVVVQHMVSQGLVRRLSFYVAELDPEGSRWSVWDFIQKPIFFSFNWIRKLFSSAKSTDSNGSSADDEPYVIVDLVKAFADGINEVQRKSVVGSMTSSAENLINYRDLMQMSRDIVADETSFRLALLHLSAQNRCSITPGDDGQKVVRLVETGDEFIQPSSIELKLFRLKTMAEKLETSIDSIAQLMARYKQSAKDSLNRGNRSEALRYLRRKKQLEPSVSNKELTLDRILALITALEQTESHKQALDAYRSGMEAFKTIKQNCGLSVDEIDKTMLNMQEMFDDSHELERTMSLAFNSPLISASDDDLERELNELLDSPSPSSRQMNASPEAETDAGGLAQPQAAASSAPSVAPAAATHSLHSRQSSPRANAVNKTSLQFPAVPSTDPQESSSTDRRQQPANKSVTVKFGKAKKSLSDESNVAPGRSRSTGRSPLQQPRGVAS